MKTGLENRNASVLQDRGTARVRTEWEARLGRWGSPKHRANLKRLAFYLKSIGNP